ncbi:MAG: hypothetical protein GTO53_09945 [Planctomycetales bacterium]|nr:hypothetical protein [Planctomycetales bacterium]NIM09441.1 hypothetical protein [Planctomycetales bacterium]NIN08923.1 hypothetical protein [Planctomycetales bacterium]NIN78044.1 hypothetical protein [Planctomycetales bacterium]NIO35222.1 hypothetical protein [Planctomycetales bacterium]
MRVSSRFMMAMLLGAGGLVLDLCSAAEPWPLPPVWEKMAWADTDRPDIPAGKPDEVSLASGAIRLIVPPGWHVTEIPTGREMRIWITPEPLVQQRSDRGGVWVTFHWRGRMLGDDQLRAWLSGRRPESPVEGPQEQELRSVEIAGRSGWTTSYAQQEQQVVHFLVGLQTGVFELAAMAPPAEFASRQQEALRLLETLHLNAPQLSRPAVDAQIAHAVPAIGLWKSLRGQLRLDDQGRVAVLFDQRNGYPLDEAGRLRYAQPVKSLQGSYQANADVLLVTWDDGSRTNYRWAIEDGQLLLTDHHGRVSQLNRLLE